MEQDTKSYVYREVSGRELEKATLEGWEFVSTSSSFGPFGPMGTYLVRRPFEKPKEMELQEKLVAAEAKLAQANDRFERMKLSYERAKAGVNDMIKAAWKTGKEKLTRDELADLIQRTHSKFDYY